jgi:hypothetical protein
MDKRSMGQGRGGVKGGVVAAPPPETVEKKHSFDHLDHFLPKSKTSPVQLVRTFALRAE